MNIKDDMDKIEATIQHQLGGLVVYESFNSITQHINFPWKSPVYMLRHSYGDINSVFDIKIHNSSKVFLEIETDGKIEKRQICSIDKEGGVV